VMAALSAAIAGFRAAIAPSYDRPQHDSLTF